MVLVCLAFLIWLVANLVGRWPESPGSEPAPWSEDDADQEPAIYVTNLPIPPLRRRKRRQR